MMMKPSHLEGVKDDPVHTVEGNAVSGGGCAAMPVTKPNVCVKCGHADAEVYHATHTGKWVGVCGLCESWILSEGGLL